jgi:hypothetical protein
LAASGNCSFATTHPIIRCFTVTWTVRLTAMLHNSLLACGTVPAAA